MTTADIRNALLTAAGDAADELNRLTAEVERLTALLPVEPPATPAVFGVDRGGHPAGPDRVRVLPGPVPPTWVADARARLYPNVRLGRPPPNTPSQNPVRLRGDRGRVADAYAKGCRVFSVSYKDRGPVAMDNLTAFLASFPDDAEILLTYWHEHDGNLRDGSLTLADYQQGCREARQVADAVGAAFGPIHNGVTHASRRKWGVNPDQWRASDPEVEMDFLWGTDMYFKQYENPADLYGPAVEYATALGLPLVHRETASFNGPLQGAWAAEAHTYLGSLAIPVYAAWWSQPHTSGDYTMTPETSPHGGPPQILVSHPHRKGRSRPNRAGGAFGISRRRKQRPTFHIGTVPDSSRSSETICTLPFCRTTSTRAGPAPRPPGRDRSGNCSA